MMTMAGVAMMLVIAMMSSEKRLLMAMLLKMALFRLSGVICSTRNGLGAHGVNQTIVITCLLPIPCPTSDNIPRTHMF